MYCFCCLLFTWKLAYLVWFELMFFFFNWIYSDDIGQQNYTGLRCIFAQHIICIGCCVFTTPSQVFFHHHLSPYTLFHLPPPLTLVINTLFSMFMKFFSLSFFFFAQSLHPLPYPKDLYLLERWNFLFQRTDRCKEYDFYKHIDFILINLY